MILFRALALHAHRRTVLGLVRAFGHIRYLILGLDSACDLQCMSVLVILVDVVGKLVFRPYITGIDLSYDPFELVHVFYGALGSDKCLVNGRRDDIDIAELGRDPGFTAMTAPFVFCWLVSTKNGRL